MPSRPAGAAGGGGHVVELDAGPQHNGSSSGSMWTMLGLDGSRVGSPGMMGQRLAGELFLQSAYQCLPSQFVHRGVPETSLRSPANRTGGPLPTSLLSSGMGWCFSASTMALYTLP